MKVSIIKCDLEKSQEIDKIPNKIKNEFGYFDILINNAAFVGDSDLKGWSTAENQSLR